MPACVCRHVSTHLFTQFLSGVKTEPIHSGQKGFPVQSLTVIKGSSVSLYFHTLLRLLYQIEKLIIRGNIYTPNLLP